MQSVRSTRSPISCPSFFNHRYSSESRSPPFKSNIYIPKTVSSWASLPTPPMSGTPPEDFSLHPSQLAGRRRKREDTPPRPALEVNQPAGPLFREPLPGSQSLQLPSAYSLSRPRDESEYPPSLPLPWSQPSGTGTSIASNTAYTLVSSALPPPSSQQPPARATRKVKAHVASACVNCKRKHLRCDESRPCRRCVQSGKEDTCRDVEHKKRGRPPLKSDDSGVGRGASHALSLPPMGLPGARPSGASSYVPLLPTPQPQGMPYIAPYAPPSIGQSSATAQGQFAASQRPSSFPIHHYQRSHAQPPLLPSTPSYGYPTYDQPSSVYPNPEYTNAPFSRRTLPSQPVDPPHGQYGQMPTVLPPILPAPPNMNPDPATAHPTRYPLTQAFQGSRPPSSADFGPHSGARTTGGDEERQPKRPRMDISGLLGPRD